MSKIAVLIPCYNEEKTVKVVVDNFRKELPEADIYVYNNNSTDKTAEIVEEMMKSDNLLHLVNEHRQGKGNVIRSMFLNIEADVYLMTDGDDTYPASMAREMCSYVLNGQADMVIGDRLSSTYFEENKRPFHNLGNVLVRKLVNMIFKAKVKDIMTGYRAFSRNFVKGFPVLSRGFEIETEMTIHALDKNFLLKEIPIEYKDRPEGSESKLNTYSDGFKVIKTIFNLFRNYKPLAFFSIIALIFFIVATILFIPILVEYFKTGAVLRFPTLFVSIGVYLCSIILFFVGVILDVIVKKHRQLYELILVNSINKK